jgi:hypothetical protein
LSIRLYHFPPLGTGFAGPRACFDPCFQGRQHSLRPDRRFRAIASPLCFSGTFTLGLRFRDCHRGLSIRSGHHVSTFLHPFTPPALPGFIATMGALTPARCPAAFLALAHQTLRPRRSLRFTCPAFAALCLQPPCRTTRSLWHRPSASWARRLRGSGLRLSIGGSPYGPAESSSSSTDCCFASGCSPPHLTMTQLPSATGLVGTPGTDLHHPDKARSRTHDGRDKRGHDTGGACVNLFVAWYYTSQR